jgi:hypothetical protein
MKKKQLFIKYRTVIPGHRLHRDCKAFTRFTYWMLTVPWNRKLYLNVSN